MNIKMQGKRCAWIVIEMLEKRHEKRRERDSGKEKCWENNV